MKISKIHIHKFNQFNDFELDLTYPKGHPKAGLPLDKVCFIGQSGTGKTTLLELVNECAKRKIGHGYRKHPLFRKGQGVSYYIADTSKPEIKSARAYIEGSQSSMNSEYEEILMKNLLFFPAGLFNIDISNETIVFQKENEKFFEINNLNNIYDDEGKPRHFLFDKNLLQTLWYYSFQDVKKFQSKEATFRLQLTHRAEKGEKLNISDELKKWKIDNLNPLELIAKNCLNPILNQFFLSVKTKIDDYENSKFIQIESKNTNEVIPYEKLSSGTRQIIFTAFPIFGLLEENSIILIDEPENSLYPDIQKEIIEYYTSFDKEKKSQFFFATHSPIIASSFEPWEIVELKFDEKGSIYRELYFDGENHVDNYHTDARYLRWDQILTKVFDLKHEARPDRGEKLKDFSILKKKIQDLKIDPNFDSKSKEFQKLKEEFLRVGELIDWET